MKFKNKLARKLRKWADRLDPAFVPNFPNPYALLDLSSHNIKTICIKKAYVVGMYKDFPNYDEYAKEDMIGEIADALTTSQALKLSKNVVGNVVEYRGKLEIAIPHD